MRVLIISPHFPPSNAADMQRVRLVLPYLREQSVEAEVLCVEPNQVAVPQDPWLTAGLPPHVPVHRVRALGLRWSRVPSLGILTFRALGALRRRGDALLREGSFDLVYFSTTQFGVHGLGPRWKKKFGVPFVMDYQDPWVSDYYREHPDVMPPGGRLKYAIASWLSRRQEPWVLRHCSGITSVSAAYPQQLARRYGWLRVSGRESGVRGQEAILTAVSEPDNRQQTTDNRQPSPHLPYLVLPFPGDVRDFERVKEENIRQTVFDPEDGQRHWVYVGVCPPSMLLAVRALFIAISKHLTANPDLRSNLKIHFVGTSYAAAGAGKKIVEPLAAEYGLAGLLQEVTDRIPYSETLRCLLDADALVIPGSDDPGYTASKVYPYLLAEKPLLMIFHERSSVVELIRKVGGGKIIPFATGEAPASIAEQIASECLGDHSLDRVVLLNHTAFAPYSACAQARQLAVFFKMCQ